MNNQKKHIDLFGELIRVLWIRKQFRSHLMDNIVTSIDKNHIPDNKKSEKLFNELEAYYKSLEPKRKFPSILLIFLLSGILIGFFLLPKKKVEQKDIPQKESIQIKQLKADTTQKKEISRKILTKNNPVVLDKKDAPDTIFTTRKKINIAKIELDTVYEQIILKDTVLIFDTLHKEKDADIVFSFEDSHCILPEKYSICFLEKSTDIKGIYENDLKEIAEKIKCCQNIGTIDINVFYTRKFYFFTNKKIAAERVDWILKKLKKNGVTTKMLRKKRIEFVRIKKAEYAESFEKIELSLDK